MARKAPGTDKFFAAVMTVAEQIGWRRSSLVDIAAEAGMDLAELHGSYTSKQAILSAFADHIDDQVLKGGGKTGDADEDGSARDRLFDVMMRRFDALNPYKEGLRAIARSGGGGPVEAFCAGARLLRSMAWMLEAAGISSAGIAGALRAKGLMLVFVQTFNVWLRDGSEDMATTMAALDRNLARAERFAGMGGPWRRRYGASGGGSPEAEPAPSA